MPPLAVVVADEAQEAPVTPRSKTRGGVSPFVVIGAGRDGIDGLQDLVDEKQVQWAIIRFELGSGSFLRHKLVFLHFNGEDCPAVRRGRANALTSDAQKMLRSNVQEGFHASVVVTRKAEVTASEILDPVSKYFVKDDLDFSWQKKQSNTRVEALKPAKQSAPPVDSADGTWRAVRCPGHDSEAQITSGRAALQAVGDPSGPWNWVLLQSDPQLLPLASGGTGSVEEMLEFLSDRHDEVLSGILRLSFGVGRLRRTKHLFVHWVGAQVGAVSRGRLISKRPEMEKVLGAGLACSLSIEVTRIEDLTLDLVIERVRGASCIDDDILGADNPAQSAFSVENFRAALREEQQRRPLEDSTSIPKRHTEWAEKDVEDVVALLHADDGPLTWALFGPRDLSRRSGGFALSPKSRTTTSPPASPTP